VQSFVALSTEMTKLCCLQARRPGSLTFSKIAFNNIKDSVNVTNEQHKLNNVTILQFWSTFHRYKIREWDDDLYYSSYWPHYRI